MQGGFLRKIGAIEFSFLLGVDSCPVQGQHGFGFGPAPFPLRSIRFHRAAEPDLG